MGQIEAAEAEAVWALGGDQAAGGHFVVQIGPAGPLGPKGVPVVWGQLDEFDGVWLDVDGKIDQVADGVEPGLKEDEVSNHFVQVYVVVQRQQVGETEFPQFGDGVA